MNVFYIVSLLAAHFIGDWYCQSRQMALKKSSDFLTLLKHLVSVNIYLFCICVLFSISLSKICVAITINAIIHGLIDWNIWSNYKKSISKEKLETFEYWKDKRFYDTIALDQFLHLATIFILFS